MRIVLDTNVFISGVLGGDGPPAKILKALKRKQLRLIVSPEIITEYKGLAERISNKYKIDISPYLELILDNVEVWQPSSELQQIQPVRDADDNKFVQAALAADVKVIISGDKDLTDLGKYEDVEVFKPRDFCEQFLT